MGEFDKGMIIKVAGPVVNANGMTGAMMYEVVKVGREGLIGEIIRVSGELATIQVYEHTGGLRTGLEVQRTGRPLSLVLGPGLIGNIYDGIQHPLEVGWVFIRERIFKPFQGYLWSPF